MKDARIVGRPGHVTGARIETGLTYGKHRKSCSRPGHVTGARIETLLVGNLDLRVCKSPRSRDRGAD